MTLTEFIIITTYCQFGRQITRPRIVCNDGFSISVQAGERWYCEPQISGVHDYSEYECGYPSQKEDSIIAHAEDPEHPTGTVYARVPKKLIEDIIERHGGICKNLMQDKIECWLNEIV